MQTSSTDPLANPAEPPVAVIKREGRTVAFDERKISDALARAGAATGEFGIGRAAELARVVTERLSRRVTGIEQIQDEVERVLGESGHLATARAYIVYREQHRALRRDRSVAVDVERSVNEYLARQDWRVHANANQGYSLGGLILNVSGKVIANYWLNHVYPPEVGLAHREADLHIHDLDMLSGYCAGWSLRTLLNEGLNGVPGKVEAGPPRHLSSVVGQIVNFLGTLQNEWAGAQAFSSFDTYLAPFVRNDSLSYAQVRQCMQELIHNLNVPSRWGTQTPFTNLTFDWTCPHDLREQVPVIGGRELPFSYGDLQAEMDLINRAYIDVMMEGDAKGRAFTFPIPTYNITRDFDWEHPNTERLFEMTAKYGLPYFQNFLNSDLEPHMVRSMCCRLQLDLRELLKRGNGLFGSAEQTGSLGVVTLNCARLGYLHRGDEAALLARTDALIDLARTSLEIKRKVIQRHIDNGLFPYTRRYLGTLRNHFSTVGVNGINEMIRNFSADRRRHHHRLGRRLRAALAGPYPRAHRAVPGRDRATCTTWKPRRPKARPTASPKRTASASPTSCRRASPTALLHQLVATAGRIHRRSVRGAGAPGGTAAQVHRRHRAASVPGRARDFGRSLPRTGTARAQPVSPALHHDHADLLDLPDPWLPCRRARFLSEVRRRRTGAKGPCAARAFTAHGGAGLTCRSVSASLTFYSARTFDEPKPDPSDPPDAGRPRAPALRGLDPRDGLSPPDGVVQHRQTRRVQRTPLLRRTRTCRRRHVDALRTRVSA